MSEVKNETLFALFQVSPFSAETLLEHAKTLLASRDRRASDHLQLAAVLGHLMLHPETERHPIVARGALRLLTLSEEQAVLVRTLGTRIADQMDRELRTLADSPSAMKMRVPQIFKAFATFTESQLALGMMSADSAGDLRAIAADLAEVGHSLAALCADAGGE